MKQLFENPRTIDTLVNGFLLCTASILVLTVALFRGRPPNPDDECMHEEHDHGVCMECGEDRTEVLAGKAEAYFEGDR